MSYISSAVILYGRFLTYKIRLTSGGKRTYKIPCINKTVFSFKFKTKKIEHYTNY